MTALAPRIDMAPVDGWSRFREAIRSAGLQPPEEMVADGAIHRFTSDGRPGDDAGWYVLHADGIPFGCYGCWRTGVDETWRADVGRSLTDAEIEGQRARVATARRAREAEKTQRQAKAATKAQRIWKAAEQASSEHPYLVRKTIAAHGIRQQDDRLIIPVGIDKVPRSLQFIDQDGDKLFLPGGEVTGGYCSIGRVPEAKALCVVEGFATGATVHQATGYPVAVAFNAGNLLSVAKTMSERFPDLTLIVCGDDDAETEGNPGRTKATEAAQSVGARLAFPERLDGVTDFNDMARYRGIAEVRNVIEGAEVAKEAVEDEWLELVSLDIPELPELKATCLPKWAGNLAVALAESTETPPELAIALVLSTCSAAAARSLRVHVRGSYEEPCNLWLVVALPPGNRKSAVQSSATAPLISWERDAAAEMKPSIQNLSSERETLQARANELRKKAARSEDPLAAAEIAKEASEIESTLPDVPTTPQLWTSDATPERMGSLLAENNERMAWLSSEGGVFDLLRGRYSGGIPNLDLMLKAWSGDAERVDRGSRPPIFLKSPLVTIGLAPQPDTLRGLAATPGFRGRGLIGRFSYLLPPSPLGYRTFDAPPMSDAVRDDYSAGVRAMLDWELLSDERGVEQPYVLRLSSAAYDEWRGFARHIESSMRPGGDLEGITDWASKAPGTAVRLAGVLHGIEYAHGTPWKVDISIKTMKDALEIMAVIVRHSQAALNQMGADVSVAAAQRVWQWVVGGRRRQFKIRDAFQALKGSFERVKPLREAMEVLEERGYVLIDQPKTGLPGRPRSPMVRVRPDIVETWR